MKNVHCEILLLFRENRYVCGSLGNQKSSQGQLIDREFVTRTGILTFNFISLLGFASSSEIKMGLNKVFGTIIGSHN